MRTLRLGEADQISQSPDGKTPLALDGSTAPGAELLGLFLLGPGPLTGGMGAVGGPWACLLYTSDAADDWLVV